MMHPVRSPGVYPREDTYYRKKHSLDFDMMRSRIMKKRGGAKEETIILWVTHVVIGLLMGAFAFLLILCEDELTEIRTEWVQLLITNHNDNLWASYLFYVGFGIALVLIACLLTIYVQPAAGGSGVAEVIAMLNGVNYNDCIRIDTFLVKAFGTLFAVCGGLCIGKEGPLVHIGAIVGVIACYMPLEYSRYLQNDVRKRQMIATGGACGLSVAFGAPIGGALFAFEISSPNTFWTFSMLWRVFVSTAISTFTLSVLTSMYDGSPLSFSDSGAVKFGEVVSTDENSILDLPAAIILGVVAGLLGAFFIYVNVNVNILRKKYVNTNVKKIIECVLFAFVTSSAFYGMVAVRPNNCKLV